MYQDSPSVFFISLFVKYFSMTLFRPWIIVRVASFESRTAVKQSGVPTNELLQFHNRIFYLRFIPTGSDESREVAHSR